MNLEITTQLILWTKLAARTPLTIAIPFDLHVTWTTTSTCVTQTEVATRDRGP